MWSQVSGQVDILLPVGLSATFDGLPDSFIGLYPFLPCLFLDNGFIFREILESLTTIFVPSARIGDVSELGLPCEHRYVYQINHTIHQLALDSLHHTGADLISRDHSHATTAVLEVLNFLLA